MTFANRGGGVLFGIACLCSLLTAQQSVTSQLSATAIPRLVSFSGKATDSQGKTITGIAGATFANKDQYERSPLWLETQNVTADSKGNYTVQLGATKPGGLPIDLFSSGEARWLGVTINGGQEQPRVLLLSVPYALKAADAETIGGLPPSAFVLANKNQGIRNGHEERVGWRAGYREKCCSGGKPCSNRQRRAGLHSYVGFGQRHRRLHHVPEKCSGWNQHDNSRSDPRCER